MISSWVALAAQVSAAGSGMRPAGLHQVRGQQFADRQVFGAQYVAEIAKAPGAGKAHQIGLTAGVNGIQGERRAGRKQVKDLAVLFVSGKQHADLDRHIAVLAVIEDHIVRDIRRR